MIQRLHTRVLVVGSGGVGSAIAASLAAAGVGAMGLYDVFPASAEALGARLRKHYPALQVGTGSKDPDGYDLVVNATPLGMNEGDELPVDVDAPLRCVTAGLWLDIAGVFLIVAVCWAVAATGVGSG